MGWERLATVLNIYRHGSETTIHAFMTAGTKCNEIVKMIGFRSAVPTKTPKLGEMMHMERAPITDMMLGFSHSAPTACISIPLHSGATLILPFSAIVEFPATLPKRIIGTGEKFRIMGLVTGATAIMGFLGPETTPVLFDRLSASSTKNVTRGAKYSYPIDDRTLI